MTDHPIRVAVIGLGKIARGEHLPAIRKNDAFSLAATADPGSDGIKGIPHYASLSELLAAAAGTIEAVAICTPPQSRCELAAEALRHGLHVLLEKPPGTSLAECEALTATARNSRRTLFCAWHSRFAGGVEPARHWLSTRKAHRASITWHESVDKWHPGQRWIWDDGGFGVFDAGINALSIATHILPEPWSLQSSTLVTTGLSRMPLAAELRLSTGRVPVTASFDWRREGTEIWSIEVETEGGALLLSDGGASLTIGSQSHAFSAEEYVAVYKRFRRLISDAALDADLIPLELVLEALKEGAPSPSPD